MQGGVEKRRLVSVVGAVFFFHQFIIDTVDHGLPAGFDDVDRDPDRSPLTFAVGALDQDPDFCRCAIFTRQHPDLIIGQLHLFEDRIKS